ncbi:YesL family protein [Clostridium sp. Marseille-P299]|uniref:YesL family protein n=1 Tax=Clostridium sp. Marseille-P299 TaxID=1805477 RepID=UPI00082B5E85|nr:YesL family protein [Clostridium sp. Marseille-P299]
MGNLFNLENGFFSFMGKVWDMILLSILWVVLCIPIVTIGPATTALYYTVVKVIRRERGYVFREFFHSFKDNFKLGLITSVIYVVLAYILYVDYIYANSLKATNPNQAYLFFAGFNAITLVAIAVLAYIFPVLSRFTLNLKGLFKTTFLMAMKHIFTTIALIVIIGASGLVLSIVIPAILFMPSLCCLLCSFLIERVFKKYMPVPDQTPEESGKDQWYLE